MDATEPQANENVDCYQTELMNLTILDEHGKAIDWDQVLPETLDFGGTLGKLPINQALITLARFNSTTFERSLVGALLRAGCQLF